MAKKILVTAGATTVPIDKVRAITNVFKGRTGTEIAKYFAENGCDVTLLTSNPDLLTNQGKSAIKIVTYKTYDELFDAMEYLIRNKSYDVVIHSAAVSDYKVLGVFSMKDGMLSSVANDKKISSDNSELYLKLTPTEKIIDFIRKPWGFQGELVKFKLQVGITVPELLNIARKSRMHSDADFIVANCLEWSSEKAYMVGKDNIEQVVQRSELPKELFNRILL